MCMCLCVYWLYFVNLINLRFTEYKYCMYGFCLNHGFSIITTFFLSVLVIDLLYPTLTYYNSGNTKH